MTNRRHSAHDNPDFLPPAAAFSILGLTLMELSAFMLNGT